MKIAIIAVAVAAAIGGTVLFQRLAAPVDPRIAGLSAPLRAVVHKTPTCGCCANYVTYLKRQGFEVEVQNHDDLAPIKEQYGVPAGMES